MKPAVWIGLAAILVVALVVAMTTSKRFGALSESDPGSTNALDREAVDAQSMPGQGRSPDDANGQVTRSSIPESEIGAAPSEYAEKPPPLEFRTIPVKTSFVTKDLVDPATLPHEPIVGHKDIDAVPSRDDTSAAATIHPMFTPTEQTGIVDDDGPLGGQIPLPVQDAPGPGGLPVSAGTSDPGPESGSSEDVLSGQVIPVDPAATPPMYVLPGDDVVIEDPDRSAEP